MHDVILPSNVSVCSSSSALFFCCFQSTDDWQSIKNDMTSETAPLTPLCDVNNDAKPSDGVPLSSMCLSHDVISEFLSGIEAGSGDLGFDSLDVQPATGGAASSPSSELLMSTPTKSPPVDYSLLTSTPVRRDANQHMWLSPIRVLPDDEGNIESSTDALFGSAYKLSGLSQTPVRRRPAFLSDDVTGKENVSPVRTTGVEFLNKAAEHDSCEPLHSSSRATSDDVFEQVNFAADHAQESCQSFGRLLGDLHLDNIMSNHDDSLNFNLANVSFSHIKCDF